MPEERDVSPRTLGRYTLHQAIGQGGLATVHLARMSGAGGFARTVAIKRLLPQFAKDPAFVAMLLDEARLASRIRHPNVVSILDVDTVEGEVFLVLDYVHGEPLSRLIPAASKHGGVPFDVAANAIAGVLRGLHAAHEATDETGASLGLVHRDVSPPNVMIGADGLARVLDFGIAKATGRLQSTREGQLKGKLAYMAPEQFGGGPVDRRVDVYAAGIMLWETLVGKRLFNDQARLAHAVKRRAITPPTELVEGLPSAFDDIVACALADDPTERFTTAAAMANALESAVTQPSHARVATWVQLVAGDALHKKAEDLGAIERDPPELSTTQPMPPAALPSAPLPSTTLKMEPASPALPTTTVPLAPIAPFDNHTLGAIEDAPKPVASGRSRGPIVIAVVVACAAIIAIALRGPSPTSVAAIATVTVSASATPVLVEPPPASSPVMSATSSAVPEKPRALPKRPLCTPPYTTDARGIRHPKPECF
jgi:serine/threonine-protein kinase